MVEPIECRMMTINEIELACRVIEAIFPCERPEGCEAGVWFATIDELDRKVALVVARVASTYLIEVLHETGILISATRNAGDEELH
jgi:hypothetical protein